MEITTPSYYHQFKCIAGICPDSCCKEWDVQVDAAAAAYYRTLPGVLGDRLRQVLRDTEDGTVMVTEDGRCPMWRQDGLCRIQAELGEEALCRTCREFPRLIHDFGNFAERQLELSCPEAARLILDDTAAQFTVQQISGEETPEYDQEAMDALRRTRDTAFSILSDTDRPVGEVLTLLLMYGYQAQAELDGEEPTFFNKEAVLEEATQFAQASDLVDLLVFFQQLEILTPDWLEMLQNPAEGTYRQSQLLALARYGVLRYWLQAISDYDLVSRVKLILVSCLVVHGLGGDIYRTAQLFSKEIENDADNVDAILDAAYTHPAFTDARLLYWLRNI